MIYLQQEDLPTVNPQALKGEEAEDEPANEESFMYFIRNGKFSVKVKTENLKVAVNDDDLNILVTNLIDGDHFGEIGMIFDCKRTATVRSENYGTLALLRKSHFIELTKTFESL